MIIIYDNDLILKKTFASSKSKLFFPESRQQRRKKDLGWIFLLKTVSIKTAELPDFVSEHLSRHRNSLVFVEQINRLFTPTDSIHLNLDGIHFNLFTKFPFD